jgi:hypothetical protein
MFKYICGACDNNCTRETEQRVANILVQEAVCWLNAEAECNWREEIKYNFMSECR